MFNAEHLWPQPTSIEFGDRFVLPDSIRLVCEDDRLRPATELLDDLERILGRPILSESRPNSQSPPRTEAPSRTPSSEQDAQDAELVVSVGECSECNGGEAYELDLDPVRTTVRAHTRIGVSYALITLVQICAMSGSRDRTESVEIFGVSIKDAPAYAKRCFMVDLGRSVFSVRFLKRIVRILAQLKMNQLHLHLYDDELCGIRFPGLPFGNENPFAMSVDDLGDLVRYAHGYGVEVVPELEGWGHIGSLAYHRKELLGGPGMPGCSAASFSIGRQSISLMRDLIDSVAAVLLDRGTIHLGLDEAEWFLAEDTPPTFRPTDLVGEYAEAVRDAGAREGKRFDLRVWADHAGRPVPPGIEETTIIEPWQYWNLKRDAIDRAIGRYGCDGAGKMRFMMGAGQSVAQYRGAYHASRYWARQALGVPNAAGINITFWGANNIDQNFFSLFVGAFYAWNPTADTSFAAEEDYEAFDRTVLPILEGWQTIVSDARPDELARDRGPFVRLGKYVWGPRHGEPVAPTVGAMALAHAVDHLNEE